MSDDGPVTPGRGQLREEAAAWFAIMRGPEAAARRADFEAWLARGAFHRDAYNRVAETFGLGKRLKSGTASAPIAEPPRPAVPRAMARALLLLALIGPGAAWLATRGPHDLPMAGAGYSPSPPGATAALATDQLSTRLGEIRRVNLSDGTIVTLDTDSLMTTSYSPSLRFLRLARGRARLELMPDPRPLEVQVEGSVIRGRGKVLDVRLRKDGTILVHVLNGSFEVSRPAEPGKSAASPAALRLAAGSTTSISPTAAMAAPAATTANDDNWPSGSIDFDQAPLAEIIAEANRYSPAQIVLGDTALATARVSGTFRVDDTARLARHLSQLLGLALRETPKGELVLTYK